MKDGIQCADTHRRTSPAGSCPLSPSPSHVPPLGPLTPPTRTSPAGRHTYDTGRRGRESPRLGVNEFDNYRLPEMKSHQCSQCQNRVLVLGTIAPLMETALRRPLHSPGPLANRLVRTGHAVCDGRSWAGRRRGERDAARPPARNVPGTFGTFRRNVPNNVPGRIVPGTPYVIFRALPFSGLVSGGGSAG